MRESVTNKFSSKLSFASLMFVLSLLAAPLYVWRFSVSFGSHTLPTNFLMIFLFAVIAVGAVQVLREQQWQAFKDSVASLGKPLVLSICAFGLATLISLFAFGIDAEKISQWVVLYLQPALIFLLIRYFVQREDAQTQDRILHNFKVACYVIVGAAGALALVQYFTLHTLPSAWEGNSVEPKRAIAFFAHPNAYSLFVTPLLAWLIPDVVAKLRAFFQSTVQTVTTIASRLLPVFLWALGGVGILLSLSRGAWLGLVAAFGVYVLINANKKLLIGFAGALIVIAGIVAVVPNLRYRVLLPFHGEKSSVARFSLWHTGSEMLKDNPILGKGVNGFKNNWDTYNTDPGLEHYNFPHNIFLNFWIDTGLVGLLSMIAILVLSAARGIAQRRNITSRGLAAVGVLLFVIALTVHGLIDIPYFKNDLALVFWMVLALSL